MAIEDFNDFQREAILTRDKDILVSAGAGSGKTSVMIERIARNIIEEGINVNEMLVVTFTNAAANEMRLKLEKKLNEVLRTATDEHVKKRLREQLDLLGQSDICTLHKFCISIIQKYFYAIDVDPSFNVGDESETALLRARAFSDLVADCEKRQDDEFNLVASTFDSKRNFNKIRDYIYKIHTFLTNLPDIDEFRRRVDEAYDGSIDENKFTTILNSYIIEMFDYFKASFHESLNDAEMIGYTDMCEYLKGIISVLDCVKPDLPFTKNHFAVYNLPSMKALSVKANSTEEDELKESVKEVKEDFSKKLKDLRDKKLISSDLNKIEQDLKETKSVLNAMFSLVERFETRYNKLKKDRNIFDFSDLEHFAYKILSDETVCAEVRARYKQIYVDEYQDINDIQEGIIARVHGARDLFLVGDVKQSIYGFRNTNPQIFLDKLGAFSMKNNEDNVAIRLNYNYRTDQKILELVNFVFGRLMTKNLGGIDYLPDNEMQSDMTFVPAENALPEIEIDIINKPRETATPLEPDGVYRVSTSPIIESVERDFARSEGVRIAEKIAEFMTKQKTIYDARKKAFREINYSDITLLCSARTEEVSIILETLADYGIPVGLLNNDEIFDEYEIQVLFAYLNLVNNPYNDLYLTTFLSSPVINLDENALARVRACAPTRDNYYECVYEYENRDDELARRIKYAHELINDGAERIINDNIYNLLNYFCDKTNYLALIGALENGQNRVKNVIGYINNFTGKKYNNDLRDYLSSVEQAETKPKISPEVAIGDNAVNVETMHKSKGLEYPIVFLINTGHKFNTINRVGDFILHSALGVGTNKYDTTTRTQTPTLSLNAIKIAMRDKDFAENLRLLYVAMTRAKNHLIITGSTDIKKLKSNTSPFAVKSRGNFLELILSAFTPTEIDSIRNGITSFKMPMGIDNNLVVNVFDCIDYNVVKQEKVLQKEDFNHLNAKMSDILAKFSDYTYKFDKSTHLALKNTVTALNRESEAGESVNIEPQHFSVSESLSSITTEQGIAYHKAMQLIDFELPSVESVSLYLSTRLTPNEMALVDPQKIYSAICQIRPMLDGARILREQQFMMRKPYNSLVPNSDITDEILVQGVIDLVIIKNNSITLIDYKTSGSHNIEKTAQNYVMQLNCYSEAIHGALHARPTQKFLYFFLQERLILIDN